MYAWLFTQKIEHAGYTRYILQQNPVRYDSEGDELDEDDEDSEADAAVAEENPFSEIALERASSQFCYTIYHWSHIQLTCASYFRFPLPAETSV
jgi:hypothetical protein